MGWISDCETDCVGDDIDDSDADDDDDGGGVVGVDDGDGVDDGGGEGGDHFKDGDDDDTNDADAVAGRGSGYDCGGDYDCVMIIVVLTTAMIT